MNAGSSRSHFVFAVKIKVVDKVEGKKTIGKVPRLCASDCCSSPPFQLSLIDLAGSEKAAKTGATKEQLEEAIAINTSLTNLGRCINILSGKAKEKPPFRDNPLTRLMEVCLVYAPLGK